MAYDLDQFIADCRSTLGRDPGPAGRETVRKNLERLLANPAFIQGYCGDDQPRGLKMLYEDPKLGFQVLAHINDKARVSPPHDHGESWAIYGQATKYTEMTEWEHEDDGSDPKHAKLRPIKKYRLEPGMAFTGPAVIEDAGPTIVIHPGQQVEIDGYRNVHIRIGAS